MLGNKVTMGQSLMVTVFSMVIVFLALLIISYLIKGLQNFSQKDKKKSKETIENIDLVNSEKGVEKAEESLNDEELVAVIAAAVAASIGVDVSNVKIKSIKRVSQNTPIWSKVGREEQIFNRL
ncbi:OadG family protein [Anaerosalibacter massiliensis]|uniref:OadG family protein n=1 Tax=Anaerosalibacter massiliensis TaxID=1347392 RepID=A0A9X2S6H5_9FIRM|nr:OadG family protein [Anaerosalibacter massiliensis]MCR2045658.1 OadG family protein [Anaerosalibacter massiliensis]